MLGNPIPIIGSGGIFPGFRTARCSAGTFTSAHLSRSKPDHPNIMSSEMRISASHANGARSRVPKTQGKPRSVPGPAPRRAPSPTDSLPEPSSFGEKIATPSRRSVSPTSGRFAPAGVVACWRGCRAPAVESASSPKPAQAPPPVRRLAAAFNDPAILRKLQLATRRQLRYASLHSRAWNQLRNLRQHPIRSGIKTNLNALLFAARNPVPSNPPNPLAPPPRRIPPIRGGVKTNLERPFFATSRPNRTNPPPHPFQSRIRPPLDRCSRTDHRLVWSVRCAARCQDRRIT